MDKACVTVIERSWRQSAVVGWAGFVLSVKLRKAKEAVKAWFAQFQENQKRKEKELLLEIERWDLLAEEGHLTDGESDLRSSLKTDLMFLYRIEETSLIQKSKLNWLKLGDENTNFIYRFLGGKKKEESDHRID